MQYLETVVQRGSALRAQGAFAEAIACFDEALEIIGTTYHAHNLFDDTGLKLMVAEDFQQKNELERAANMKERTVSSRLMLLQKKNAACRSQ